MSASTPELSSALLAGPEIGDLSSGTLTEALERAAASGAGVRLLAGEKPASELPYSALLDRAAQFAAGLSRTGVCRGDRVVIMLPTSVDFLATYFGTLLAGGVPVPVAPVPVFGSVERTLGVVRHIVGDAQARLLVTDAKTAAARDKLFNGGEPLCSVVDAKELAVPPVAGTRFPSPSPDDTALIQYTSGTTSLPRGVELSHRALLSNAHGIGSRIRMTPADVGVSWLPLFHDMGLIGTLFTSVYWRYRLVLLPTEGFLMHPRRWLQAIGEYHGTLSVAPNFAYRLAETRIDDKHLAGVSLTSWRCALNGSEAVDVSTVEAFAKRFAAYGYGGSAMTPVYGLAENCLAVTFPEPEDGLRVREIDRALLEEQRVGLPPRPGHPVRALPSVGTPLCGQKVAILGDSGELKRQGEVGEVAVGGVCVMKGYRGNEAATSLALRDGWLHTGDLGFIADGRLYIAGRAKELIIRRGRNYYPYDIERVAAGVSGASAAAIGCDSAETGTEELVLLVESKLHDAGEQEALKKRINSEVLGEIGIAAERIVLCASRSLPRTTSGKLQRGLCKRLYLSGTLPVTG